MPLFTLSGMSTATGRFERSNLIIQTTIRIRIRSLFLLYPPAARNANRSTSHPTSRSRPQSHQRRRSTYRDRQSALPQIHHPKRSRISTTSRIGSTSAYLRRMDMSRFSYGPPESCREGFSLAHRFQTLHRYFRKGRRGSGNGIYQRDC
jgi:hypothetical protein